MEDQFGGRTDDDLFFDDDFEPVDGVATIVHDDVPVRIDSRYITHPSSVPHPADIEAALAPLAAAAAAAAAAASKKKARRRRKSKSPKQPVPPRGGLAQSRFAEKPVEKPPQNEQQRHCESQLPGPSLATTSRSQTNGQGSSSTATANASAPRDRQNNGRNQGKPSDNSIDARAQSGANPRHKLTEEEMTAKMEKMKLLSAEKTRKFEKAEQDEKQHAEAYARGMEEARRQRAETEEKRRQNEEQRRRLEEERTKNRERKLKAINMKQDGWDQGKEVTGEEESRRPARAVNGGSRGSKASRGSGLRGSRFAPDSSEGDKTASPNRTDDDRLFDERPRRGGRGRGNRGEGRAGRGGRSGRGGRGGAAGNGRSPPVALVPKAEDFPSLPPQPDAQKEPAEGGDPKPATLAPLPRFAPAIGKWEDDMEFLDETNSAAAAHN
ncbi:hypothetical protein MY11210_007343 [Beauveria gryllotalpidicola]